MLLFSYNSVYTLSLYPPICDYLCVSSTWWKVVDRNENLRLRNVVWSTRHERFTSESHILSFIIYAQSLIATSPRAIQQSAPQKLIGYGPAIAASDISFKSTSHHFLICGSLQYDNYIGSFHQKIGNVVQLTTPKFRLHGTDKNRWENSANLYDTLFNDTRQITPKPTISLSVFSDQSYFILRWMLYPWESMFRIVFTSNGAC